MKKNKNRLIVWFACSGYWSGHTYWTAFVQKGNWRYYSPAYPGKMLAVNGYHLNKEKILKGLDSMNMVHAAPRGLAGRFFPLSK